MGLLGVMTWVICGFGWFSDSALGALSLEAGFCVVGFGGLWLLML